jgi:hypothetical protein
VCERGSERRPRESRVEKRGNKYLVEKILKKKRKAEAR